MHDETPPFSPHNNEGLVSLFPCKIFETKLSKDDYCEHEEDRYNQGYDVIDEDSPIFDKDLNDDYWTCMEKPIFDISREGSVDAETLGSLGMEEAHSDLLCDHSYTHTHMHVHTCTSTSDKDLRK